MININVKIVCFSYEKAKIRYLRKLRNKFTLQDDSLLQCFRVFNCRKTYYEDILIHNKTLSHQKLLLRYPGCQILTYDSVVYRQFRSSIYVDVINKFSKMIMVGQTKNVSQLSHDVYQDCYFVDNMGIRKYKGLTYEPTTYSSYHIISYHIISYHIISYHKYGNRRGEPFQVLTMFNSC